MPPSEHILGIDIGSVTVSYVLIDRSGRVVTAGSAAHKGRIRDALRGLATPQALRRVRWVAATSSTPRSVARSATFDSHVAAITAAKRLHPDLRALLLVGGERFSLARFDEDGEYFDAITNSACAAGTGSFLEEQATALGLRNSAELASEALAARGAPPRIASRCAVFAKTDLIHAQQEGYSRGEICNGLCRGLANIVADTLDRGDALGEPVVFAGGVARNRAVRVHLEARLGARLEVDDFAQLYGAQGAALCLLGDLERGSVPEMRPLSVDDLVSEADRTELSFHEPLELRQSDYPDFAGERRYEVRPVTVEDASPVEVDVYRLLAPTDVLEVYLGIDVGSTSTKAVLLDREGEVLVAVYTRTAGRPLQATQGILEAIHDLTRGLALRVLGAGTTGSGRKLIGAVIGADLVVDEITAHARAAYELDPGTDTILEIGGQDAKFTTLRDGMVTSAVMNNVCAAGTGSFIEEQARRLDCPLAEYSDVVAGARAPLSSDRCTVFMQRDINHLLARGHSVSEILATALHSVCENYLQKVAREGSIGEHICFQGATGKNRALVAAFEQRLGRPIRVSRYCHVTGALGVAYLLAEMEITESRFRGVSIHSRRIPIRNEVCELCRNHCKIVVAEVRGETAAYGFLCGRDYGVDRFVDNNTSGFDLLKTRRRILRARPEGPPTLDVTVGLPAGLYMYDDLELWRRFFQRLGVRVVTSERCRDPVGSGKRLTRAEFCAPMTAWHGHIEDLLRRVDYVFAPIYLEARRRGRGTRRQYCYYSQYASPLAVVGFTESRRILRPLITHGLGDIRTRLNLHKALRPVLGESLSILRVVSAHVDAIRSLGDRRAALKEVMRGELEGHEDVAVVLLGRPYACLAPQMNKGIPGILGALGVKTFFQDMLEYGKEEIASIADLLQQVHWKYAAQILESACVVARTPGLYPVLVTSFKCAPDSLTLDFFRRILDAEGKPYLVLELDEHDSSVGCETRIEAAVRSFRNHLRRPRPAVRTVRSIAPNVSIGLDGRTLFLPNWDRLSCTLVAAGLRREGIDTHVLPEDELTIRKSLRRNTGQCIPLNAMVEGFVDEVRARGLDPARTALWTMSSEVACNIGMYPSYMKAMLDDRGGGFEHAAVYQGEVSCMDISLRASINTYFAFMFGGMLRRMACRVRPYEVHPGEADAAVEQGLAILAEAFENRRNKREAVREVVDRFAAIETIPGRRPKVAIFGDLYVRDNEVMSQDLVRFIESHGGEVLTTPYSEYARIIAAPYFRRWLHEGRVLSVMLNRSLMLIAGILEKQYAKEFSRVLGRISPSRPKTPAHRLLARFAITGRHAGESFDNVLKVYHILENDPDVSLFVQANPAFCCPALVTEAMAGRIRELTGVPVVTVTYDGTAAPQNEAIIPYLGSGRNTHNPKRTVQSPSRGRRHV